jgi:SPP1 family predicted phage head-tail adaptor
MRAGQLDQIILIESRVDTVDAVGQPVPSWSTWAADVPAAFDPAKGREFFSAQGLQVERAARFRTRWLTGLAAGMRVVYDGATWDIASVEQMYGRDRELHIYAATGLTAG